MILNVLNKDLEYFIINETVSFIRKLIIIIKKKINLKIKFKVY
jgi:hypothetical protein